MLQILRWKLPAVASLLVLGLFPACGGTVSLFDKDADGFFVGEDCDDNDPSIGGLYLDVDGDGYGTGAPDAGCLQPDSPAYVSLTGDCDDADPGIYPGAEELCDGVDSNCDGPGSDADFATWYRDADEDGYGSADQDAAITACSTPVGYVSNQDDCDDDEAAAHPSAAELCDGADNDCDGYIDEGLSDTFYTDADRDGFGDATAPLVACAPPDGSASNGADCDDDDADVYPGAAEACNSIDDDCDQLIDEDVLFTYYPDQDADGFGDDAAGVSSCSPIDGSILEGGDCNDADTAVNPTAEEVCDYLDNNCDDQIDEGLATPYYPDLDQDGYGDEQQRIDACEPIEGDITVGGDCDDHDAAISPDGVETCNVLDDDCDGAIDEDFDQDGDGYSECSGDCDDADAAVSPGALELCDDVDNDCDGTVNEDQYEPNDSLETAIDFGDRDGSTAEPNILEIQSHIYSLGDASDFYRLWVEDDWNGSFDDEFYLQVTLSGIPADANYDLYLWWDDPNDYYSTEVDVLEWSEQTGNQNEYVYDEGVATVESGGSFWVEVRRVSGYNEDCSTAYTLVIENGG